MTAQQRKDQGVFKQERGNDYVPFDDQRLRQIVNIAEQKKNDVHLTNDQRNIQHQSLLRTAPLGAIVPDKASQSVQQRIEAFRNALIQWATKNYL